MGLPDQDFGRQSYATAQKQEALHVLSISESLTKTTDLLLELLKSNRMTSIF